MFDFFKKTEKVEFSLQPLEEQCIPYACHYDDYNLLTKNGELMQVIKIEGYSKEMINSEEDLDLRAIIRKSIIDNIKDRKVAIWFHTIRRKRNLDSINYYSWTFAKDTHDSWAQKNYWRDKFVNELYVTILYDSDNHNISKNFSLSIVPKALKQHHLKKLAEKADILDKLVLKMLSVIKIFGGKRLGVVHDRFGARSEILEFLTKIVCLQSKRVALPIQGID
jgi:type IV secretion system protein VirB4